VQISSSSPTSLTAAVEMVSFSILEEEELAATSTNDMGSRCATTVPHEPSVKVTIRPVGSSAPAKYIYKM
jgi:hypothetical protein